MTVNKKTYQRIKIVIELAERMGFEVIFPEDNPRSETFQLTTNNNDWPLYKNISVFQGDFEQLENFLAGGAFVLIELQKMNVAMPEEIKIARRDAKLLDALQHSEERIANNPNWSDDIPF